jgi:acetyl-CoA carboxylase carboxyltransferase component
LSIVPAGGKTLYSTRELISNIFAEDSFIEVHGDFVANMITGFSKLNDITVGIVANNPMVNSGCIDRNSSDKVVRFVRFCDSFNILIITFVDTLGYFPGVSEEHNGIIRRGANLLFAYPEVTIIKITIIC